MRTRIIQANVQTFECFLREWKAIPLNKLGPSVSQKNAKLYALPFGTSTRLWIPLTDQKMKLDTFMY
jgi:hypothetical protein